MINLSKIKQVLSIQFSKINQNQTQSLINTEQQNLCETLDRNTSFINPKLRDSNTQLQRIFNNQPQLFHIPKQFFSQSNSPLPPTPPSDQGNSGNENPNNNNNNNNNSNQKDAEKNKKKFGLDTISLRQSWKSDNVPEDAQTYILFNSQQALLPYNKQNCQVKLGNLTNIDKPLAFFLLNDFGESYTVGIELERNLQNHLKNHVSQIKEKSTPATQNQATKQPSDVLQTENSDAEDAENDTAHLNQKIVPFTSQQVKVELSTQKMSNRLKIVELIVNNQGIFAKTVPFNDREPTKDDLAYNTQNDWNQIKKLVNSVNKSLSYEQITGFNDLELQRLNFREFDAEQIDQVIFQLINCMYNIYNKFMNININSLIQSIFESDSPIDRLILIRTHLQSLEGVLKIVDNSIRKADQHLIRMQNRYRATLSIEYIKANYFKQFQENLNNNINGQGPQIGSSNDSNLNNNSKSSSKDNNKGQDSGNYDAYVPETPANLAQQYFEKLNLIEEQACRDQIRGQIERFAMLDKNSTQFHKLVTYLDEVFSLPWKTYSPAFWDINYAKQVLDQEIYGLEKVKERIIQMIAVNQIQNSKANSQGFVLLLYGPPGTGKTSIAKAIAASLKQESRFISFAGVSDPHFIKGHRRTYVDSQPGIFVKEIIKAQSKNPVFIVDEIDKISRSSMGADPYYSLLEILNPDESKNFTDHYLDIKFDFSNVVFILTANNLLNMLEPLRDRLEIIEIPAYIEEQKLKIGQKYIIPKSVKSNGLPQELLKFNDQTVSNIIRNWCFYQSGVRELKRCFETISRQYAVEIIKKHPELANLNLIEKETQNPDGLEIKIENITNLETTAAEPLIQTISTSNGEEKSEKKQVSPKKEEKSQVQSQEKPVVSLTPTSQLNHVFLTPDIIKQYNIEPLDLTSNNQLDLLQKYLGVPQYDSEYEERRNRIFPAGTINILTVAGFAGNVLTLECAFDYSHPDQKGTFTSSGNLKEVLKESLTIGKINSFRYLSPEQIQAVSQQNIHIHFMQGATPKDGPSAGIAICTAFLSLVLDKPVPARLSMTGELSLQGEVCQIGGIQSKLIASKSVGATSVIVPHSNMADVVELPKLLLDGMTIYFVKEYKQVYSLIFEEQRFKDVPKGVLVLENGEFVQNISGIDILGGGSANVQNIIPNINANII